MVIAGCQQQWLRLLLLWLSIFTLATVAQPEITTDTCSVAICTVIDASGSVGVDGFETVKLSLVNLIDLVSQVATVAQYGASVFAYNATPVAGLSSMTSDATAAKLAINNIPYPAGGTNTEAGIAECFSVQNGARSGVITRNILPGLPRVLLLITDGLPNWKNIASPPPCPCNPYAPFNLTCKPEDYNGTVPGIQTSQCAIKSAQLRAADVRDDGIKFFSIGVGPAVDAAFLATLGGYTHVDNFIDLQSSLEDLLQGLCSDVDIQKSASVSPQPIGGGFSFIIDVINTGKFDIPAGGVNFTDTFPPGLEYDSSFGVQPLGSSPPAACSYNTVTRQVFCTTNTVLPVGRTWSYALAANATEAGEWTNTATVITNPGSPTNKTYRVNVTVTPSPPPPPPVTGEDLNVTKTVDQPTVILGTPVTYTITVKNTANATTADNVFAVDTVPPGLEVITTALPAGCTASGRDVSCGPSSLAPGQSVTYSIQCLPEYDGIFDNSAVAKAGSGNSTVETPPVVETVTVTHTCTKFELVGSTLVPFKCVTGTRVNASAADDTNPSEETCCIPLAPEVVTSKSVTPTSTVVEGSVSYRLTVSNTGDGDAKDLILEDELPEGLVFVDPLPVETAQYCYFRQRLPCEEIINASACVQPPYTILTCGPFDLGPGETKVFIVPAVAVLPGVWINTANVTYTDPVTNKTTSVPPPKAEVSINRTCVHYNNDSSPFECGPGTEPNLLQANSTNTSQDNCCKVAPSVGACCLPGGKCRIRAQASCSNEGGVFHANRTCHPKLCRPQSSTPSPHPPPRPSPSPTPAIPEPTATGACCVASSRSCQNGATKASCQKLKGTWSQNGECSVRLCPAAAGACCLNGQCLDLLKEQCSAQGGAFNLGILCSSGICGASCTPSWLPCVPCTQPGCSDKCCSGNSCKPVHVQGSQSYYTCTPDEVCSNEGQSCGDCPNGAVCCAGLICKWNYYAHAGTCTKPCPCGQVGQSCKLDTDCCPGARCGIDGKCRSCSCNKKCSKVKNTCDNQQLMDCGAVSAAAASGA